MQKSKKQKASQAAMFEKRAALCANAVEQAESLGGIPLRNWVHTSQSRENTGEARCFGSFGAKLVAKA